MRRPDVTFRIAGLALIALVMVALWKSTRISDGATLGSGSRENATALVSAREKVPTKCTEKERSAKTVEEASTERLSAFVVTQMREWESDDDPELRDQRTQELESVLARNGRTDSDRLKLIETLPARLMDFAFGLPSFQEWMFSNPNAALDWIRAHPGISDARVHSLLQDWLQQDSAAFARYLEQLPEGQWRQKVVLGATYAAMSDDPATAIACACQLNPDNQRNGLLELVTTEWARREPTAACRWVAQVRDPALRMPLIGALLVGYAELAPDLATQWATATLPPGKILDRTMTEIALVVLRQD